MTASEQDLLNTACSSEIELRDSVEEAESAPTMGTALLEFAGENCADDMFMGSDEIEDGSQESDLSTGNVEEGTCGLISPFSSRVNRTGLLREQDEHDDLWQRLNELDRFCGLYLEQLLQDCVDDRTEMTLTKHLEQHQRLRVTTEMALTQLPKVARMQAELEHYVWTIPSLPVAKLLKVSPKPQTCLPASTLNRFTLHQLQLLMNDLHASVHNLNNDLLIELSERDELHGDLGRKCSEVKNLATHFKDLCIGLSVNRYRRQLSNPLENTSSDISHPFAQVIDRLKSNKNMEGHNTDAKTAIISKSRLLRMLFSRRSTKF